jgi:hypothetical protein
MKASGRASALRAVLSVLATELDRIPRTLRKHVSAERDVYVTTPQLSSSDSVPDEELLPMQLLQTGIQLSRLQ